MQLLQNKLFLGCAGLYTLNRFGSELMNWQRIPYVNDLLCLPVVLTLTVVLQRALSFKNPGGRLHKNQAIFTVLYISVLFEGILPAMSLKYTQDYWDVGAYAVGAFVYYFFINPKKSVPKSANNAVASVTLPG